MKKHIYRLITWLFPHVRVVNFRTKDGIATNAYAVENNTLHFFLLKKPLNIGSQERFTKVKVKDTQYKGAWVNLKFYTPESVDNLIKKLDEIKLNLELLEAAEILKMGGEMVWTKRGNESTFPDYPNATTQTYEITFKMPDKQD